MSVSQRQPQFRLASQSPRRAALLHEAGYHFTQQTPPFDDPAEPDAASMATVEELATRLAREKAQSLAEQSPGALLILAADTICVDHEGFLVGKPRDRDHARQILLRFMGQAHQVITGVALWPAQGEAVVFADSATVALSRLKEEQLDTYLDSDQWAGKAGAYNLFDRQQAGWPLLTVGDPTTIVGLPMRRLAPALASFDIHPCPPYRSDRA